MMAGNPNWWSSMSNMHHHLSSQYIPTTTGSSSQLPFNSLAGNNQDFPQSWNQLLMEGGAGNSYEDKSDLSQFQTKKIEIREEEILNPSPRIPFVHAKLEALLSQQRHQLYGNQEEQLFHASRPPATWSGNMHVSSSPARSCISSSGNNINVLEFSDSSKTRARKNNQVQYPTSECMSTATNGVCKKARVQSSSLPPLKVRKEKLGDRITALHQLVSPFGKTDTASVLLETTGYIRFLQSQIEALCSPYLGNGSERNNQHSVQGERNFIFPKDPGQEGSIDLRSRGLSLVPISYTHHVGSDNGADLWTPTDQGEF